MTPSRSRFQLKSAEEIEAAKQKEGEEEGRRLARKHRIREEGRAEKKLREELERLKDEKEEMKMGDKMTLEERRRQQIEKMAEL